MIQVGSRVTKDGGFGTVLFLYNQYCIVVADGGSTPLVFLLSELTEVIPIFEVGKNYRIIGTLTPIYHCIYKIDDDHFVFWLQPDGGGIQVTMAANSQRPSAEEVV